MCRENADGDKGSIMGGSGAGTGDPSDQGEAARGHDPMRASCTKDVTEFIWKFWKMFGKIWKKSFNIFHTKLNDFKNFKTNEFKVFQMAAFINHLLSC